MNRIFRKELLQYKIHMVLFFIIITFLFSLTGILLVNNKKEMAELAGPDIEIYGKFDDENFYAFYSKLNVEQWDEVKPESVDSYNLVVRNIVNMTDEITLERVELSVMGCSTDFMKNKLSGYVVEGRVPELDCHEVMMGEKMANFFGLSVGSVFDKSLVSLPPHQYFGISTSLEESIEPDDFKWTVTGIIESNQMQYDCGIFVPAQEDKLLELCNKVNIYIDEDVSMAEYLEIREHILTNMDDSTGNIYQDYFHRVKKQNEMRFILIVIVVNVIMFTYILMLFLFKNNARKVGMLTALGLKNRTIIKYYLSLYSIISLLGFVAAIMVVSLYIVNRNKDLVVILGVSETAYALDVKSGFVLLLGEVAFLLLLAFIIGIKVWRCNIKKALAQK